MGRGEETGLRIDQRNWRRKRTIAGRGPLTTRAPYKVSRTPRCRALPTRCRSASEKRQGTKSREVEHQRCSWLYGDW